MPLHNCRSRHTHWKQTVFYLNDIITMCEGEKITGCTTQMLGMANLYSSACKLMCVLVQVSSSAFQMQRIHAT